MPPRRSSGGGTARVTKRKQTESLYNNSNQLPPRIRYFDKDAISEHLHCPICQEVFNYPIALQCGHVFCESCIKQWLRPPQKTCPECRMIVDLKYSHKDLTAHKFLDSVPVYCSFLGCAWIGRMDTLQSHVSECECDPGKLPDYMVNKEPKLAPSSSSAAAVVNDDNSGTGTTSLRMKLFKGDQRELLTSAGSGDLSLFASSSSHIPNDHRMQTVSDLTSDIVRSADIIGRHNKKPPSPEFVDISDSD